MKNAKKKLIQFINFLLVPIHIQVRSAYLGGRLFPESFLHLKKVLKDPVPATVIDVGVADGTPELWSAFPPAKYKYLLVEANPAYAEKLKDFGTKMNAVVEQVFCGDHDGIESFITDTAYDSGKASKYSRKVGGGETRSNIPSLKLDTIVKRHSLPHPYILKIDVEGAELDVLRGATEVLTHTEAIIIETPIVLRKEGASSFGEIVSFLHQRGFAIFDIAEMSYHQKTGFLNLANAIFVKEKNPFWN